MVSRGCAEKASWMVGVQSARLTTVTSLTGTGRGNETWANNGVA